VRPECHRVWQNLSRSSSSAFQLDRWTTCRA
jgi:hypothetical protein